MKIVPSLSVRGLPSDSAAGSNRMEWRPTSVSVRKMIATVAVPIEASGTASWAVNSQVAPGVTANWPPSMRTIWSGETEIDN
ncbi:MAG: hypothetical protein GY939_16985 [Actinomycetia bacterium]|nr:hypothetical protein [Actinomycetes bacterium]